MNRPPDHATLQQAAHWYARLSAAPEDAGTQEAWHRWHAQDETHRQAWHYVERIRQRFQPLQDDADGALHTLRSARESRRTRRQVLLGLGTLSVATLLGWSGWRSGGLPQTLLAWRADYRSGVGEVREISLVDGTRVWLNSASALDVDFSVKRRLLLLRGGEILIETGRDPRPFLVETRQGRMRALGTRFSVTQQDGRTRLAVFEGAVEVRSAVGDASEVVQAGEQLGFDAQRIDALTPAVQARQAWARGLLLANDIPLSEFVAELARYRHGHLGVDPSIAGLRVMGTYPLHDTDRALAMLESALPLRVQRTLPWWVSLEAR
ncbi:FecR domain-containing protein [Pseudomonas sp.]|uniref:FecR domain-containing protein n=1 Tax=Pseudomonas sp. TaxID=306 RepID=UPI0028AE0047|nr:FecR domain-containing protein [Pseudomonas sp.]